MRTATHTPFMSACQDRAIVARSRLERLRAAAPEHRHDAYGSWLEVATAGEVRRYHKHWMGVFPEWARA